MEDSIHLATDIYLPSSDGTFPTILYLTPFDRRDRQRQQFCQFLVSRGFAVLIQNPRGLFGSEGDFRPFVKEAKDFEQTLEWALSQSWCNGDIGLYGHSLSGYNAQLLASTQHPAIKAVVNQSGITRTDELFFPGGAFRLNTIMPLLKEVFDHESLPPDEWKTTFNEVPLSEKMVEEVYSLYQMSRPSIPAHRIKVPTLQLSGWNDWAYRHTFFLYNDIKKFNASVPQHLVIGPWEHQHEPASAMVGSIDFGNASLMSATAYQRKVANWFEHYVSGKPNPVPTRHQFFIMGLNQWVDIPNFPPEESESIQFLFAKRRSFRKRGSRKRTGL